MDIIGVRCSLWETTTLNSILVVYTEVDTIEEGTQAGKGFFPEA